MNINVFSRLLNILAKKKYIEIQKSSVNLVFILNSYLKISKNNVQATLEEKTKMHRYNAFSEQKLLYVSMLFFALKCYLHVFFSYVNNILRFRLKLFNEFL